MNKYFATNRIGSFHYDTWQSRARLRAQQDACRRKAEEERFEVLLF